jgi:Tfp pilus assembly protein PilN
VSAQPDFATAPRPRRPAPLQLLALGVAAALLLASARAAIGARAEAEAARQRLAAVRLEVEGANSKLRALAGRLAGEETSARAALVAVAPPPRIVTDLAETLPREVRLTRLSIAYGRGVTLELEVEARHVEAWDRFLDSLERHPRFAEVAPGPERREGEVRTSLTAVYVPDVEAGSR